MITFAVSEVTPAEGPLRPMTLAASLEARAQRPFEASASNQAHLVNAGSAHGLVAAARAAFDRHYPLVLSPDDIWLCLAQGFAIHVGQHAEALRSRIVAHQGKKKIGVRRDDFIKGSPSNDWPGVFSELSDRLAEQIGKKRDLIVADFSTTGLIERAASQVVLFDALQSYFDYRMVTSCGIPQITLLGTVEDWRSIRRRAQVLAEFDLTEWTRALLPVLDKIVKSAEGDVDRAFWQSFYKNHSASGGPYVTGWINVLFPYLDPMDPRRNRRVLKPNPHVARWSEGMFDTFGGGPSMDKFPTGLSSAPFLWTYLETDIPMVIAGGFTGVSQDAATGAVRPSIGWAIGEVIDIHAERERHEQEERERSRRAEHHNVWIEPVGTRLQIALGGETIVDTERALDVSAGGKTVEDGAWSYSDPPPRCREIRGYVAFYLEKMGASTLG
jgi:hypothetical protein